MRESASARVSLGSDLSLICFVFISTCTLQCYFWTSAWPSHNTSFVKTFLFIRPAAHVLLWRLFFSSRFPHLVCTTVSSICWSRLHLMRHQKQKKKGEKGHEVPKPTYLDGLVLISVAVTPDTAGGDACHIRPTKIHCRTLCRDEGIGGPLADAICRRLIDTSEQRRAAKQKIFPAYYSQSLVYTWNATL